MLPARAALQSSGPDSGGAPPDRAATAVRAGILAAGATCALYGGALVVAWIARATNVLEWPRGDHPVVFNTALAFVVTGTALIALVVGKRVAVEIAGGFDVLLGLGVLAEHVLDRGLGIDQVFVTAYVHQAGAVPGRMAINTALCFVIVGLGLLTAERWQGARVGLALSAIGSLVAAIAALSLFGYATAVPGASGWGGATSMAVPTASTLIVVGTALVLVALRSAKWQREWLAMPAGMVALSAASVLWLLLTDRAEHEGTINGTTATRAVMVLATLMATLVVLVVWLALRAVRGRQLAEELSAQRLQAEQDVRSSEARLVQILDSLPMGIFVTRPDGSPYYANAQAERLVGADVHPDGAAPKFYPLYAADSDRPYPAEELALIRAKHGVVAQFDDVEVHQPDGTVIPVEVRGGPIFAADRSVEYALLVFDDISRRKAAERSLADQAALIDLAYDAIFVHNQQHVITFWSRGAELTYGFSRDEAVGQPVRELLRTEFPVPPDEIEAELNAAGSWQGELIQHRSGGERILVASRWAARRSADGTCIGTLEVNRDITSQQAAAEYARSLLEASLDPLVTISADGKITDVNESAVRATGVPRHQLIGTDFSDYFTEPERAREGYQRVFAEGTVTDYPLTIRHTSGALREVVYNASVYRDRFGEVRGVFAAARDITARKRAEEELARRAAQLEAANRDLGRSNADLEQFAYIASHDLSEPLRAISGPISLLARRYQGQLDDEADEFIGFAVDGCERMQSLINGLLTFSRVGRLEGAVEAVDAEAVAKEAVAALGPVLDSVHATVTVEPLPTVFAEPDQLSQVFQNLIGNAVKFVAPGVVPRVGISAEPEGNLWRFDVVDNGIGIDPAYRERIFSMFKRLHSRDEYPGTGIGLALVKKIVERHGGEVGVADAPSGTGCRFWFTLPRAEGQGT